MKKAFILATIGTWMSLMPAVAVAQAQVPGPAPEGADEAADASGDIIVTAQRRNEKLKDVPVTVTVASNEKLALAGIEDATKLSQVIPALKIDFSGSNVQPSLRGIGTANAGPGVSSSIATYIDGFYVPSPSPSGFNFANVENIQVLAGPQGTLFGRNSTAGAILVTTKGPSPDLRAEADLSYGRWNSLKGNLFLAGPLSDDVSLSLFASGRRTDGFVKNVITGDDANEAKIYSFRGKLRIEPSEAISFTLGGEYAYLNDPSNVNFSPYLGRSLGVLFFGAPAVSNRGEVANYGYNKVITKNSAFNLTAEADLGFGTLKSFSQYRRDHMFNLWNFDGSAAALVYLRYHVIEKTYSQEFNLSSNPGGDLSWTTGLFLYRNTGSTDPFELGSGGPNPAYGFFFYGRQKTTTIAPYADATYRLGDLFLTAGARYSIDTAQKDHIDVARVTYSTPKITFKEFTPRAILRYDLSGTANIYASFSKGNKPGIYNGNSADPEAVRPEELTAYEVGTKLSVSNWSAEASAFYYDYKNLQVATYTNGTSFTRNAGKVEIYGAQLHVAGPLAEGLRLDTGLAYTHGTYKKFDGVQIYDWNPALGGVVSSAGDVSGRPIQRSPEWSGNLSLTYDTQLGGGDLKLNTNASYQSKTYFDPNGAAEQDGYALVNASAAYTPKESAFTFSVLATNVTDSKYLIQVLGTPVGFGQIYGEPRSYMLRVAYRY
jgi:iron complex outermembrane receptor protein